MRPVGVRFQAHQAVVAGVLDFPLAVQLVSSFCVAASEGGTLHRARLQPASCFHSHLRHCDDIQTAAG